MINIPEPTRPKDREDVVGVSTTAALKVKNAQREELDAKVADFIARGGTINRVEVRPSVIPDVSFHAANKMSWKEQEARAKEAKAEAAKKAREEAEKERQRREREAKIKQAAQAVIGDGQKGCGRRVTGEKRAPWAERERIAGLIKKHGLVQAEIQRALGLGQGTLCMWLHGKSTPDAEQAQRVEALVHELVGKAEAKPVPAPRTEDKPPTTPEQSQGVCAQTASSAMVMPLIQAALMQELSDLQNWRSTVQRAETVLALVDAIVDSLDERNVTVDQLTSNAAARLVRVVNIAKEQDWQSYAAKPRITFHNRPEWANREEFARLIREHKISIEGLRHKLGHAQGVINCWLKGKNKPDPKDAEDLEDLVRAIIKNKTEGKSE